MDHANATKEVAYYYPNWMWECGDWIKNLILFFDGIAILLPAYKKGDPERLDPPIVEGLKMHNLLYIIEPEKAVDKPTTEKLATILTDVITSGALDKLDKSTNFQTLSKSRMGYYGDAGLAKMIFEELKQRGLAEDSRDGLSIPLHPMVRTLILTLLSQLVRPYGTTLGAELSPVTDVPAIVGSLNELLSLNRIATPGSVVEFDLNTVSVDLGAFPIDEVLDFRRQYYTEHRAYCLAARSFANALSRMNPDEREHEFAERQATLEEIAAQLRDHARKAWRKPASFALTLLGAAIAAHGNPLGALISAVSAAVGYQSPKPPDTDVYSYLFRAQQKFGY